MLRRRASPLQPMKRSRLRQVPRRRTPRQTGHRPPLRPDQILQVLAHGLLIAQVVKLLHQAVEQRFVGRAPHELNLNRPQRSQRHRQRRGVDQDCFRPRTRRAALTDDAPAHRRQLDLAGPLQHQQQAAADHVAQRAVGLFPSQRLAQLPRQFPPAAVGMLPNELSAGRRSAHGRWFARGSATFPLPA